MHHRLVPKKRRRAMMMVSITSKQYICVVSLVIVLGCCNGFTRPTIAAHQALAATARDDGHNLLQLAKDGQNDDFWEKQRQLALEMTDNADKSLQQDQKEKFAKRRLALVADTAYFTLIIFCILWGVANTVFTPVSYVFGAIFGLAYSYGLGKYVETLGGSAEDAGSVQGAGVGQARFAFLILLFVIVGKFRSQGLQEIPAILGFFTYQLASLNQGLKEIND